MKRILYLAFAIVAVAILSGDAVAQQQQSSNNVQFGRGRLLRKWRNQLYQQQQKQKRPTPAKQGQQPTPAKRPTSADQSGTNAPRVANPKYNRNAATRPTSTRQQQSRSNKKRGFGMRIEVDKSENFVVTHVDSSGNAAAAGIRRGDFVTQLGGADITAIEEFNEIVKVLGEGDQMEMQISRRGQKQDVTVQYGEIPEVKESDEKSAANSNIASPAKTGNSVTGPYDFVPKNDSQFRSVLEGPVSNYGANPQTRPSSSRTRYNRSN